MEVKKEISFIKIEGKSCIVSGVSFNFPVEGLLEGFGSFRVNEGAMFPEMKFLCRFGQPVTLEIDNAKLKFHSKKVLLRKLYRPHYDTEGDFLLPFSFPLSQFVLRYNESYENNIKINEGWRPGDEKQWNKHFRS